MNTLIQLKYLDISDNNVFVLQGLGGLTGLNVLRVANNKISLIQHLNKLTHLVYLDLSFNKISVLQGLSALTWLERLDVASNEIREIHNLDAFGRLEVLDMSYNRLASLEEIEPVTKLPFLKKLTVYGNPFLKEIPSLVMEEFSNHLPDLKNYFSAQKSKTVKVVLPVKVMLLGNHSCGKTSFLHYLYTQTLPPETTNSTHILDIRPYPRSFSHLPEAIIYDFGGQDYYHGLYRAFFSLEAVNVLMWCNEYDKNQIRRENSIYTRDYTKEYWLYQLDYAFKRKKQDSVQSSEPLLLVQTHADRPGEKRNYIKDGNHTFEIVNEFYISLEKDSLSKKLFRISLEYLRETLLQEIENKKVEEERPVYYQDFLKFILSFPFPDALPVKELKERYKREKLPGETNADLENYLKSDLRQLALRGMVLYYPESPALSEVVWLNPSETIRYIHSNVLSPSFLDKKKGVVNEEEFDALCYTHPHIKELLIAEKVIFYDPAQKNYIIPSYLPLSTEKEDEFDMLVFDFSRPDFILKFNCFIPFGLINQLICLYGNNPDKKRFWSDQLIFIYRGAYKIWIKLDFTYLEIAVYIAPKNSKSAASLQLQEVTRLIFRDILRLYWGNAVNQDKGDVLRQEETKNVKEIFKYHAQKPVETDKRAQTVYSFPMGNLCFSAHEDTGENRIVRLNEQVSRIKNVLSGDFYEKAPGNRYGAIKAPDDMYISLGGTYFSRYKDIRDAGKDTTTIIARPLVPGTRKIDEHTHKVYPISIYKNFTDNEYVNNMKKIFISYSRKDVEYKDELKKHLDLLRTFEIADSWSCEEITIGKWDEQIQKELEESDLIIYMLSAGFFSSKYILEKEVQKGLDSLPGKPGKKALCVIVSAFAGLDKLKAATSERESSPLQDAVFQLADMQYLPYCKVKNEVTGNMEEKIVPLKKYPDIDDALAQICEKVLEALR
ncbi:MAG: TIR domain-containing protein [Parabacteroides sp.]|nr:TIR domain-containing protein [Parabacteroides sp.]